MFVHLREEKHPKSAARSALTNATQTGSRRLLTYRRLRDAEISVDALAAYHVQRLELQEANPTGVGGTANDLNDFRKKVCQHYKCRFTEARSENANVDFLKCSISKDSERLNNREMRYEIYVYGKVTKANARHEMQRLFQL
jgi:hypothetical protein